MKCPICALISPPSALRCDCGYDFTSGQIRESYIRPQSLTTAILGQSTPQTTPVGCVNCAASVFEEGYALKLCQSCRTLLAHRRFPLWTKCILAGILIMVGVACTQFGNSLRAGIAYKQGLRAEFTGDYPEAVAHYELVTARFPDSTLAQSRLGIAYYRAGYDAMAATIFQKIAGRKSSRELVKEVNHVIEELSKNAK